MYKARDRDTGRYVTLKDILLKNETQGVPSTAIRKISVLKRLRHPNGARLLDALRNDRQLHPVLEYMTEDPQKPMTEAASGQTPLAVKLVKVFVWQLLQGIAYRVSHVVLKPRNLVVDVEGNDLGLARTVWIPLHTCRAKWSPFGTGHPRSCFLRASTRHRKGPAVPLVPHDSNARRNDLTRRMHDQAHLPHTGGRSRWSKSRHVLGCCRGRPDAEPASGQAR